MKSLILKILKNTSTNTPEFLGNKKKLYEQNTTENNIIIHKQNLIVKYNSRTNFLSHQTNANRITTFCAIRLANALLNSRHKLYNFKNYNFRLRNADSGTF